MYRTVSIKCWFNQFRWFCELVCVSTSVCVCECAAFEFASALANKSRESIAITYCALFIGFNWHFKVNSFHFDCWLFWIGSLNGTVINISILRDSCCVRESHWLVRPQNGKVNGFFVCVCLLVMTLNDKNGRCTIVFFFWFATGWRSPAKCACSLIQIRNAPISSTRKISVVANSEWINHDIAMRWFFNT